eukprot:PhF_6_TR11008/c0_g1_i1/m.17822
MFAPYARLILLWVALLMDLSLISAKLMPYSSDSDTNTQQQAPRITASTSANKNPVEDDFGTHMHCSLCMSYCFSLQRAMDKNAAPSTFSPSERQRFLAREDRVEDVLQEALRQSTSDYVWVNERSRVGRFWHMDLVDLDYGGELSDSLRQEVKKQQGIGGDVQRKNFVRLNVVGPHEEYLENVVAKNNEGGTLMDIVKHVCVDGEGGILCSGMEQLRQVFPRHKEDVEDVKNSRRKKKQNREKILNKK